MFFLFTDNKRVRRDSDVTVDPTGSPSPPLSVDCSPSGNESDGPHSDDEVFPGNVSSENISTGRTPSPRKKEEGRSSVSPNGRNSASPSGDKIGHSSNAAAALAAAAFGELPTNGNRHHSSPSSTSSSDCGSGSNRRSPLELLMRVFPKVGRGILQVVIRNCNGDVVQAIEQVLNSPHHTATTSGASKSLNGSSTSHPIGLNPTAGHGGISTPSSGTDTSYSTNSLLLAHRPYLSAQNVMSGGAPHNAMAPALKSAFSPLPSLAAHQAVAAAAASNQLRYTYPNTRGLALAMPYPPSLMPNLATLGAAYANYNAMTPQQKLSYSMCACPYGTSPTDK